MGVHKVAPHYGVRSERYKLIHFPDSNEWELFDLNRDPGEMLNLYSNPEYASRVGELKDSLNTLVTKYDVELEVPQKRKK
jgi:arylsulfatase A-like enzyme